MLRAAEEDFMSDPQPPPELADHPLILNWPVQWGDQDAFGHVNNVVYFRWMESARIEYFRRSGLGAIDNTGIGPILATIKCDFRRQLKYPDALLITGSILSIGRTSMKMAHRVYSQTQQAIAAEGDSVLVFFDYRSQRPIPVPDNVRAAIDAFEGRGTSGA
jgi:acyl-CoA thioester hydrolase